MASDDPVSVVEILKDCLYILDISDGFWSEDALFNQFLDVRHMES